MVTRFYFNVFPDLFVYIFHLTDIILRKIIMNHFYMKIRIFLVLWIYSCSFGGVFTGNWNNSVSLQNDRLDTFHPYVTVYENLGLYAGKIANTNLSFYSNLNFANWRREADKPEFDVTSAYIDWDDAGNPLGLRAGRQSLWEAMYPVPFDGVKARFRFNDRLRLTVAGGAMTAPEYGNSIDVSGIEEPVTGYFRAEGQLLKNTSGGLSCQQIIIKGKTHYQDVTADAVQKIGSVFDISGNLGMDFKDPAGNQFHLVFAAHPGENLLINAEIFEEKEKIITSIYLDSLLLAQHYGCGCNVLYSFSGHTGLYLGYLLRSFAGLGESHRLDLEYTYNNIFAALTQEMGYGGTNTRGDIGFHYKIIKSLEVRTFASYMLYDASSLRSFSSNALYATAGLEYVPLPGITAGLDLQAVSNRYYNNDLRLHFSTRMSFSRFYK
jgi:hypothetical protein